MKKYLISLFISALLLAACSKTEKSDMPAPDAQENSAPQTGTDSVSPSLPDGIEFTEDGLSAIFTDPQLMTADQLETIVLAVGKCQPKTMKDKSWYNLSDCPAYKVFNKFASGGSKSRRIDSATRQSIYRKILKTTDNPVLRDFIYSHLNFVKDNSLLKGESLLEADQNAIESVLDIVKNEKDVIALHSAVANLTMLDGIYKHPDLVDFLLDTAAKHSDPLIRRTFAEKMTAFRFKGVEKAKQTVSDLCKDEDKKTKDAACGKILEFDIDKADVLAKEFLTLPQYAGSHAEIIKFYNKKWLDLSAPDAKAYQTVLDYLKTTPRSEDIPAWSAISDFSFSSKWKSKSDAKYAEWLKAADFYREDELLAALSDIVVDPNASYLSRINAADNLLMFGSINALKTVYQIVENDKANESRNKALIKSIKQKLEDASK